MRLVNIVPCSHTNTQRKPNEYPKIRRKYAKYSNKALMFGYTKGLALHSSYEGRQHVFYVGSLFIDKEEASFFTSSKDVSRCNL